MIREITSQKNDGLGPCKVFSKGAEVDKCLIYANTETGEVRSYKQPLTKDAEGNAEVVSEFLEDVTIQNSFESKEAFAAHEASEKERIAALHQSLPENPTSEDFMKLLRR